MENIAVLSATHVTCQSLPCRVAWGVKTQIPQVLCWKVPETVWIVAVYCGITTKKQGVDFLCIGHYLLTLNWDGGWFLSETSTLGQWLCRGFWPQMWKEYGTQMCRHCSCAYPWKTWEHALFLQVTQSRVFCSTLCCSLLDWFSIIWTSNVSLSLLSSFTKSDFAILSVTLCLLYS
jgi:hypothetical protein